MNRRQFLTTSAAAIVTAVAIPASITPLVPAKAVMLGAHENGSFSRCMSELSDEELEKARLCMMRFGQVYIQGDKVIEPWRIYPDWDGGLILDSKLPRVAGG